MRAAGDTPRIRERPSARQALELREDFSMPRRAMRLLMPADTNALPSLILGIPRQMIDFRHRRRLLRTMIISRRD